MKYTREKSPDQQAKERGISRQAVYKSMEPRPDPEFDPDGYPTNSTLEMISNWKVMSNFAVKDLLSYVGDAWRYGWPVRKGGRGRERWIYVATGGWSGNESLIGALQDNSAFWAFCWLESRRGGGFKFKVAPFLENEK